MEGSGLDLEADFSGALPLHVQRRSAHRRRGQNRKQKFGWGRGQGQKHLEDDDSTNEDTELVGKINSFECLHALRPIKELVKACINKLPTCDT